MTEQLIGVLVVHTIRNRYIVNFIVFQAGGIVFFINDTADAFVGHIPTNAVFVVGAEDKAATAICFSVEKHCSFTCST